LWTVASGDAQYLTMQALFSHWLLQLLLLGWVFSTFYHLCNGIRHLFWDVGRGYEIESLYASGKAVLAVSISLTGVFVYLALQAGGAQ
ncbi:MAG: succinate dehydrogenase, cytochrome b556 subunit, partial [Arenicella sp.]|nr:succinate dehydrogenase, cytochrome b556 subunit [Arenicella sp.]